MDNLTLAISTIGDMLLGNRITRKNDGKPQESFQCVAFFHGNGYLVNKHNIFLILSKQLKVFVSLMILCNSLQIFLCKFR